MFSFLQDDRKIAKKIDRICLIIEASFFKVARETERLFTPRVLETPKKRSLQRNIGILNNRNSKVSSIMCLTSRAGTFIAQMMPTKMPKA